MDCISWWNPDQERTLITRNLQHQFNHDICSIFLCVDKGIQPRMVNASISSFSKQNTFYCNFQHFSQSPILPSVYVYQPLRSKCILLEDTCIQLNYDTTFYGSK
ncbi:hypothetical protein SAY87_010798 [Trapa incisa]|uniref:Uncharacterized protein n=1 Tax=Trapa incisa TaxID=236973 RepID=A0AAN7JB37_9MYRT|nr:hypothetical protein SAY87_010798 [Trapa incisa]